MSKRISVVIEYEEGQEQPSFHADMELLGGKVVGVMLGDALRLLEKAEEDAEDAEDARCEAIDAADRADAFRDD